MQLQSFSGDTIPRETEGVYIALADGHEEAVTQDLTRGQYRMKMTVPFAGEADSIRNRIARVPMDGEFKRVYFYKLDVVPNDEPDPETGENTAEVTAVFRVMDNILPIVPVAWGVAKAVGVGSVVAAGSGWLFLDKVERVSTNPLAIIPILAALATLALFLFRS